MESSRRDLFIDMVVDSFFLKNGQMAVFPFILISKTAGETIHSYSVTSFMRRPLFVSRFFSTLSEIFSPITQLSLCSLVDKWHFRCRMKICLVGTAKQMKF